MFCIHLTSGSYFTNSVVHRPLIKTIVSNCDPNMTKYFTNIHVMEGFLPYFRVFQVFNAENFHGQSAQILQNGFLALFVLILVASEMTYMILMFWSYLEKGDYMDPRALPSISIGFQMLGTLLSATRKNRLISETMRRLQRAIKSR